MNAHAPLAIGIDIGGTHAKIGLVSVDGAISVFRRIPTRAQGTDPGPFLEDLIANAREVRTAAPAPPIGIGISTHGYIDDARRGADRVRQHARPARRGPARPVRGDVRAARCGQ